MKRWILALCLTIVSLNAHEPKRVLVAGGAGFLGSHLCERLLERGDVVVCLDNLQTGNPNNVQTFLNNPHFFLIHGDICEFRDEEHIYDEIYNLACPASPPRYQKDPIHTLETNYRGTKNLLEQAKRDGAVFFQASTSEVYGNPLQHPQKETYFGNVNPIGIRACYDEGKRIAETLCFEYHRQHAVAIKVVRIFNTYGPNMSPKDGRVVSNFMMQALSGKPITVYGDGSQTRSFCFVDDLINGFLAVMNTESDVTGPVNLGNPAEITVKELAERIIAMTQSPSLLQYKPLPQDDPVKRKPDITLAKTLGWQPETPLETGLQKTADYFRKFTH